MFPPFSFLRSSRQQNVSHIDAVEVSVTGALDEHMRGCESRWVRSMQAHTVHRSYRTCQIERFIS